MLNAPTPEVVNEAFEGAGLARTAVLTIRESSVATLRLWYRLPVRGAVLAFGQILLAGEVVLVLFQHVLRIQLRGIVIVVDGEVVTNIEVDTRRLVAQCVFDWNLPLADEM
nr:hypothetical protein [Halocatena marina]